MPTAPGWSTKSRVTTPPSPRSTSSVTMFHTWPVKTARTTARAVTASWSRSSSGMGVGSLVVARTLHLDEP